MKYSLHSLSWGIGGLVESLGEKIINQCEISGEIEEKDDSESIFQQSKKI